jgi:hypothetical protein
MQMYSLNDSTEPLSLIQIAESQGIFYDEKERELLVYDSPSHANMMVSYNSLY